jgi:uncharacterized protein YgiM (DUF1202 family)
MLLSAVVATSWVAAQSDTEQPTGNIVVPGSIFVRSGPGEQYVAVGALFAGDRVTPVNRSADGFWILIPYNRSYGWVQRYLILWENEAALDLLPILEPDVTLTPRVGTREPVLIPTFTPEGNWVRIVDAESAYLRAGPGRTYLRLGQLFPGEQVEPVSRNADGNWIMIRYTDDATDTEGFAWIARSLVSWVDVVALDDLPVVNEANLTPTLTFTPSTTPAPSNTPSDTPTATDTATATNTPTHTLAPTNTATPTSTPTQTETPSVTPSHTSTPTATSTNTPTDVPTATHTVTATYIPSVTPSDTATATDTNTPTDEPTATDTSTNVPTVTDTPTDVPTITPSDTATATETSVPSATATDIPTNTPIPSDTPTDVPSATPAPSDTPTDEPTQVAAVVIPTDTPTIQPTSTFTNTPTNEPTATDTPSVTPSDTATATDTNTSVPSDTPTDIPSNTPVPSVTPTNIPSDTPVQSNTSTTDPTQVAVVVLPSATTEPTSEVTEQVIILPETAIPTEPITAETVPVDGDGGVTIPLEAIIGVSILLIVLGYIFLFWRGLVAADRYRDGFVIDECPVCKRGGLTVEEKPGRLFGIPQTRRTVRCDVCRSVLRETGAGRWRYAVDRIENPTMYDRFNGKEISDDELVRLSGHPPKGSTRPTNPTFVDEDSPDKSG